MKEKNCLIFTDIKEKKGKIKVKQIKIKQKKIKQKKREKEIF